MTQEYNDEEPKFILVKNVISDPEYWSRKELDEETVQKYVELLNLKKDDIYQIHPFPPIVLNPNNICIDGNQRLAAYKRVERAYINYRRQHVDDDQVYIESIKLNKRHGKQFSKVDIGEQVFILRHIRKKTGLQVAELLELSESHISRIYHEQLKLRNLSNQDANDNRVKTASEEILKRLGEGQKQKIIASDLGISPARVSQIKKAEENARQIEVILDTVKFQRLLNHIFKGTSVETVEMLFYKQFLLVNMKEPANRVLCFYPDYFIRYEIKQEFSWLLDRKIDDPKGLKRVWKNVYSVGFKLIKDKVRVFFNNTKRMGKSIWNPDWEVVRTTPPLPNILKKLDGNNVYIELDTLLSLPVEEIKRIPVATEYQLNFDEKLTISGVDTSGYYFIKSFEVEYEEAKPFSLLIESQFRDIIHTRVRVAHHERNMVEFDLLIQNDNPLVAIRYRTPNLWCINLLKTRPVTVSEQPDHKQDKSPVPETLHEVRS